MLLLVIVGPNASGKSELAVRIAKRVGGEIISADSRQIYKSLSIGTGKVPGRWQGGVFRYRGVPHHLIDEASPKKNFTVADFKKRADKKIVEIAARGKLPILVGGTGFWIDAVAKGMAVPEVPPDPCLRKTLSKKPPDALLAILKRLDPSRAKTIEKKNPRRLIRAIEIARALGRVPELKHSPAYRTFWIGIFPGREALAKKIQRRLERRMRDGLIKEAKTLRVGGMAWKRFYELGLEYRFLADLLRKKTTKEEFAVRLAAAIRRYARRQMTWFKKNRRIRWFRDSKQAYAGAIRLLSSEKVHNPGRKPAFRFR